MSDDLDNIFTEEFDSELDELVNDLRDSPPARPAFAPIVIQEPNPLNSDQSIEKYINDSAQKSNSVLQQVIINFANSVGDDPDRAAALATLIKSNTDLLKVLNDQITKNRDNVTKLAIQRMKSEGDILKETIGREGSVVSSRDEMFAELFKEVDDVELVDDFEEDKDED